MTEDTQPDAGEEILDAEEIIAAATRPERSVSLCLRADLNARFDELEDELAAAEERDNRHERSLGSGQESRRVAEEIEQLRDVMRSHSRRFRLRAMEQPDWWEFDKPRRDGSKELPDSYFVQLVSKCLVNPVMSEEQVKRLFGKFAESQRDAIVGAAWNANNASVDVPKSLRASRVLGRQDSD